MSGSTGPTTGIEEEGHTSSISADGDHVVIRTNGGELEATQFSHGEAASTPSSPGE